MIHHKHALVIEKEEKRNKKLAQVITTHMLHSPTVVCQSHGQDQWERSDNCFSEENRISLGQASQRPVKTI